MHLELVGLRPSKKVKNHFFKIRAVEKLTSQSLTKVSEKKTPAWPHTLVLHECLSFC